MGDEHSMSDGFTEGQSCCEVGENRGVDEFCCLAIVESEQCSCILDLTFEVDSTCVEYVDAATGFLLLPVL